MRACVQLRLPDGRRDVLFPGDLVGRAAGAALPIDDPHVSEAHAIVSLRGEELVLLALRRRLYVDGKAVDGVVLRPGLAIRLSPDTEIVVDEVLLPEAVLGLEGDGLPAQVLPGSASLVLGPHARLVAGPTPDALATFWSTAEGWRVRVGSGAAQAFGAGTPVEIDGRRFVGVDIPLARASRLQTRADPLTGPLRIISFFDTVHIHRGDGPPVVLSGQLARLLAELVSVGAPVAWTEVAALLWPEIEDRDLLRRRWDVLLVRLRERLRVGGIRNDLVRSSGVGLVELLLLPGDQIDDRG